MTTTPDAFDALLAARDELEAAHKDLCREMDWNKLRLTPADKYHFRGKWFKVDFDRFAY